MKLKCPSDIAKDISLKEMKIVVFFNIVLFKEIKYLYIFEYVEMKKKSK